MRRRVFSGRAVATACAALAATAVTVALVGNIIDDAALEAFVPGMPGIKVLTATSLLLLVGALWLARDPGKARRVLCVTAAFGAAAISVAALVEYSFDTDLGLAGVYDRGSGEAPGAMSPQTAVAGLLLAAAFLALRRWPRVAQGLSIAVMTVGLAAGISIAFGIHTFLGMAGVAAMSLPGAIAVGAIGVGVVALDTNVGVGRLLVARTSGGRLARRGLAVAIVTSVTFGVAILVMHESFGLVTSEVAASLYFLGSVLIASGLVLPLAFSLDRVDRARASAIQGLVTSEALGRELIEHAPEAIVVLDVELGRFVRVNPEAERLLGLPSHELLRRSLIDVSAPLQEGGRPSELVMDEHLDRTIAGEVPVFDWLLCTPTGRPIESEVRLLRLPDPGRTLVRGSMVEIGSRKRAEAALRAVEGERAARAAAEADRDRIAALQRITARLLAAPSVDDVAAVFVDQVVPDLGAMTGVIFTLTDARLVRRGHTPDAGDPDWSAVALDSETTSAAAVRSGKPVIVVGTADAGAEFAMLGEAMRDRGYAAFASFPLYAGEQLVGVGSFGYRVAPPDDHWLFLGRVAERVGPALERARLFEAERDMRRQLEHAAERAAAMQRVTEALARAITADEVIDLTATLGIEALGARAATAGILDSDASEFVVRTFGFPVEDEPWRSRIGAERALPGPDCVREQRPLWFSSAEAMIEVYPETRDFVARSRLAATACVPLIAWGRPLGFLAAHYSDNREFGDVDRVVFTTLASISAQALERARRFESERETASVLQQSMLPARLPELANVAIAARYSSAGDLDVGGDWYDAVALDDGSVIVTVGDVVGRGLAAAATMGQLRSAISALSLATGRPRDVLARLDGYATHVDGARLATVAIARIDPSTETLQYASAGHVPGVLILPGGSTQLLEPRRSLPLDALPDPERDELHVAFPAGSTLVLYTDGLIERRGESLDIGLRRLVRTAGPLHRVDVHAMCEQISAALLPSRLQRDDVAVLCVRLEQETAPLRLRFPASPSELAPLRRELRTWLADAGLSPQRAADLVLAVDEACANAMEHAYNGGAPGDVVVEVVRETPDRVVARVHDAGCWREQERRADRGRGLGIIRAAVDEFEIHTDTTGTTVLLKQRAGER